MYYLSHLIFTIIKVHFTNENTIKNVLDAFVTLYLPHKKKYEDKTNIHDCPL